MNFTNGERLVSKGIQSDIFVGMWGNRRAIKKVSGEGLSHRELGLVLGASPKYREQVRQHGIEIPDNLDTRIVDNRLETVDSLVDGYIVNGEVRRDWERMVEIITTAGDLFLDAKPPNFMQNGRAMFYVDTFPPMLREGEFIAPWIQKLFKRDKHMMAFNFGDVRGRLTKLLSLTRIEMPSRYDQLSKVTLDVARQNIRQEDYDYVLGQHQRGLPDMSDMYKHPELASKIVRRIINA